VEKKGEGNLRGHGKKGIEARTIDGKKGKERATRRLRGESVRAMVDALKKEQDRTWTKRNSKAAKSNPKILGTGNPP